MVILKTECHLFVYLNNVYLVDNNPVCYVSINGFKFA